MAHNHVELFAFQSCRSDPAAPLDQTDHAAAARLVRSCLAKPYKLHKGEPWPRDLPVKPRPHTVWYETASVPPPAAAAAATALASDSTRPERTSTSNRTRIVPDLPEFRHWRHLDPSARSGPTRSRRGNHPGAVISAPSATTAQPNQGLLRKRPLPAAVAGAWAPTSGSSALQPQGSARNEFIVETRQTTTTVSSGGGLDRAPPGRQKKTVRVESPRTTAARTASDSATTMLPSTSRSPLRGSTTTRSGRPATEELAAASRRDKIVPVPRSGSVRPRPSLNEHDGDLAGGCSAATAAATARPSRGIGAIERCIPPPYAHRVLDPLLNPVTDAYDLNPARQEPSAVLHSFVDPDYSRRRRQSSAEAGGKVEPGLPLSSPLTMEFLAPGRRGAWLIPISEGEGPVPPYTSPVTWPDKTLTPSRDHSSAKTTTRKARSSTDGGEAPAVPLEWTDARLVVLWIYLTGLHEGRGFGNIRAQAISGRGSSPGDLLKINCDAHLALAIRGLLNHLNVKGVAKRVSAGDGGGGGGDNSARERLERLKREGACNDDDEKWLKGRALVWVDEQSRAILTG